MNLDDLDQVAWPKPHEPSAKATASIQRQCTAQLLPAQPVRHRSRLGLSIAVSLIWLALLLVVGHQRHPERYSLLELLALGGAWAVLQVTVLGLCHARTQGRRAACGLRKALGLTVLSAFLLHIGLSAESVLSFDSFLTAPHSLRHAIVCHVHTLLFGAMAIAALIGLWSRTDPFSPGLTGALTGLAGGLVGSIALDLVCTSQEAWHLWLGHGLALVILVVVGRAAGRRWLSP